MLFSFHLSVMSQNSDIAKAYSNIVTTIKEYYITSINIKEVDLVYNSKCKGNLVFKNPLFRFDGQNIVFSYKHIPKNDYSWVSCDSYETGSYIVTIPVKDLIIREPEPKSMFPYKDYYYIINVINENGIIFCKDNVKELVRDYSFAASTEMTATKFYNEFLELINQINIQEFNGKLGYDSLKSKSSGKKTSVHQSRSNKTTKVTITQQSNNRKSVINVGNKRTNTIIK